MWYTSSMMSRSPNGHQVESWGKTEKVVEKLRKLLKNWESCGKLRKLWKTEKVVEKLRKMTKNWEFQEKLRKLRKNWESYVKTEKVDKNWESCGSSNTTAGIL